VVRNILFYLVFTFEEVFPSKSSVQAENLICYKVYRNVDRPIFFIRFLILSVL